MRKRSYTLGTRAESLAESRERIAQAGLELWLEQAYEDVTLAAIAAAADVSHQTVLNHFGSKEGVALAAAEILRAQTQAARALAHAGDARQALGVLIGEYERIGDANARWAAASERLGSLAELLEEARMEHQRWLERVFDGRLPPSAAARTRTLHALHAATDASTWKLLRRDLRLSRADTIEAMLSLVDGALRGGAERAARGRR